MSVHGYISRRKDSTLHYRLAEILGLALPRNTTPVDGVATFDVVVDFSTGVNVRFFVPTQDAGHNEGVGTMIPVVLYFYGGGFVLCRPNDPLYDQFCRCLAKWCRVVVVSVHYRTVDKVKSQRKQDITKEDDKRETGVRSSRDYLQFHVRCGKSKHKPVKQKLQN